jgi:nitrogen fixation protein
MKLIIKKFKRPSKEQNGLNQVAGVGNSTENFYAKFKIKDLIEKAKDYPIKEIPVSKLSPFLKGREENATKTKSRIEASELKYPIIVVANESEEIFSILDGTHRVQKAMAGNLNHIKGHIIPKGDLEEFVVTKDELKKFAVERKSK